MYEKSLLMVITMSKKCTIFYSWQSDIKVSRNFISDCLDKLRKKIKDIKLCLQDEEQDYQYVDVNLKDGNYTIIEGSMRDVPKG